MWSRNLSAALYGPNLTSRTEICVSYKNKYIMWAHIHSEIFTHFSLPILKCTQCKEIHLSLLKWILCDLHMIKPLAYTLLLCFLLSFKKILPSWTTSLGHIWEQCCSDCSNNAAKELRHNRHGLSDAVRLLVHVLKLHPTHLLHL